MQERNISKIIRLRTQPSLSIPDCITSVIFCQVEDLSTSDISSYFEPAFSTMSDAIYEGKRVLVHCHAGKSRSPAVVIAFLIQFYHISLKVAYRHVERVRNGFFLLNNLNLYIYLYVYISYIFYFLFLVLL